MQLKELRIALVCYGGVSLAVYMHGVTKELWQLARASRSYHSGERASDGIEAVYRDLLLAVERQARLRLRVLPDILTGASAGGINAVFLAQAIHSGHSLEPLTELWLDGADVERLVDPKAEPMWRFAKLWAQPIAEYVLRRPGNVVSDTVAPETREEVRTKVSRLVRGRWFSPPFSGLGIAQMTHDAIVAMSAHPAGDPLLPPGHPIDLYVTATDFHGFRARLRLNSPPVVEESEHRVSIEFRSKTPALSGFDLADPLELTFAARATASFPGAFPPLQVGEIDELARIAGRDWAGRDAFLRRIMPVPSREGTAEQVSLIDGSVLVNAPFAGAMASLSGRPAQREVDRRFVYIDPRPDRHGSRSEASTGKVGFFGAIFGSLSTIPREQPIRDNLEAIQAKSRDAERLQLIIAGLRPEVELAVEKLFGRTLFLDRPTPRRLNAWRAKAQQAAAENAGYAFQAYAQAKFSGILAQLARLVVTCAPDMDAESEFIVAQALRGEATRRGLASLAAPGGGASEDAIAFFRAHDIGFRIRRLRLLARRLARDWEADPDIPTEALDTARDAVFDILGLYFEREGTAGVPPGFDALAGDVLIRPGAVLDALAHHRLLPEVDEEAEVRLAALLAEMPRALKRRMLLTYLGFPFYDVATLSLLRNEGLTEFDPVKVDRISPEDARSIREGGTRDTLRGTEFYNFGAFFSRAYRENDYLWGRLHGAERMIDLVCSTLDAALAAELKASFKQRAFLAILDEEQERLQADRTLVDRIRREVASRLA